MAAIVAGPDLSDMDELAATMGAYDQRAEGGAGQLPAGDDQFLARPAFGFGPNARAIVRIVRRLLKFGDNAFHADAACCLMHLVAVAGFVRDIGEALFVLAFEVADGLFE